MFNLYFVHGWGFEKSFWLPVSKILKIRKQKSLKNLKIDFKNILKICSRISFLISGYFFLSSDIISDFNKFNLLFFLTF